MLTTVFLLMTVSPCMGDDVTGTVNMVPAATKQDMEELKELLRPLAALPKKTEAIERKLATEAIRLEALEKRLVALETKGNPLPVPPPVPEVKTPKEDAYTKAVKECQEKDKVLAVFVGTDPVPVEGVVVCRRDDIGFTGPCVILARKDSVVPTARYVIRYNLTSENIGGEVHRIWGIGRPLQRLMEVPRIIPQLPAMVLPAFGSCSS